MKEKRNIILFAFVIIMMASVLAIGFYYVYKNNHFVSTENAKVSADLINITPQISGKILEINTDEGEYVNKNEILSRIEMNNISYENIEKSLIRSPIEGIIVKKRGCIGEFASSSQTIFTMINPKEIYIIAEIEETKINKIKIGQKVEIKIDQFGSIKFDGKVKSISDVANSALSILPSSSSTFTKVVQRIPVKIQIKNNKKIKLIPGTNAIVKIHIK